MTYHYDATQGRYYEAVNGRTSWMAVGWTPPSHQSSSPTSTVYSPASSVSSSYVVSPVSPHGSHFSSQSGSATAQSPTYSPTGPPPAGWDYYGSHQPSQPDPVAYSYQTGTPAHAHPAATPLASAGATHQFYDAYGRSVGSSSAATTPAPSNSQGQTYASYEDQWYAVKDALHRCVDARVGGAEDTLRGFQQNVPHLDAQTRPAPTDHQLTVLDSYRRVVPSQYLRAESGSSSSGVRDTVRQIVTSVVPGSGRMHRHRHHRDRDDRRHSLGAASSTDSPFEVSARTARRYDI